MSEEQEPEPLLYAYNGRKVWDHDKERARQAEEAIQKQKQQAAHEKYLADREAYLAKSRLPERDDSHPVRNRPRFGYRGFSHGSLSGSRHYKDTGVSDSRGKFTDLRKSLARAEVFHKEKDARKKHFKEYQRWSVAKRKQEGYDHFSNFRSFEKAVYGGSVVDTKSSFYRSRVTGKIQHTGRQSDRLVDPYKDVRGVSEWQTPSQRKAAVARVLRNKNYFEGRNADGSKRKFEIQSPSAKSYQVQDLQGTVLNFRSKAAADRYIEKQKQQKVSGGPKVQSRVLGISQDKSPQPTKTDSAKNVYKFVNSNGNVLTFKSKADADNYVAREDFKKLQSVRGFSPQTYTVQTSDGGSFDFDSKKEATALAGAYGSSYVKPDYRQRFQSSSNAGQTVTKSIPILDITEQYRKAGLSEKQEYLKSTKNTFGPLQNLVSANIIDQGFVEKPKPELSTSYWGYLTSTFLRPYTNVYSTVGGAISGKQTPIERTGFDIGIDSILESAEAGYKGILKSYEQTKEAIQNKRFNPFDSTQKYVSQELPKIYSPLQSGTSQIYSRYSKSPDKLVEVAGELAFGFGIGAAAKTAIAKTASKLGIRSGSIVIPTESGVGKTVYRGIVKESSDGSLKPIIGIYPSSKKFGLSKVSTKPFSPEKAKN